MALERYGTKRDFTETPEPRPEVKSSPGGNLFVIQKHAARALHYDVRLEMNGVLLSWAVPKGPSLDPRDKHLAVHVEDHPLDYAHFEGIIPKGEYGGGTVMVWDIGTWSADRESKDDPEKAYREGHLKFRLEGEKLHGGWMLVRMKPRPGEERENWLLFKERDDEVREGEEAAITRWAPDSALTGRTMDEIAASADRVWGAGGEEEPGRPHEKVVKGAASKGAAGAARRAARGAAATNGGPVGGGAAGSPDPAHIEGARKGALPERLEPELATLVTEAPVGDDWLHEIKLDGYRVMTRIDGGAARLFTRRGADWTSHFPTLRADVARIPARHAVLDGEVVYVKDDGRTSFLKLASALQSGTDPDGRVVYYVFDLLHLDGYDLTRVPLHARKEALERLLADFAPTDRVRFVGHLVGKGEEFFDQSCDFALEGSIAKRASAPYRSGRGRDWLKVKCMHRQEFVVGGFTERANAEGGVGALLVGFRDEAGGPLRYAGRVGTGWDDRTMRELRKRLDKLLRDEPPFEGVPRGREVQGVVWAKPELVAEIEYLSWNGNGMFRHPSFEGLRLDKPAAEVVVERAAEPEALHAFAAAPRALPAGTHEAAAEESQDGDAMMHDGAADRAPAAAVTAHRGNGRSPAAKKPVAAAKKSGAAKSPAKPDAAAKKSGATPRKPAKLGEAVDVSGVSISNPKRVLYPDLGLSKLEVARYYEMVAPWMLPQIARRPLTLVRCPEGYTAQCFFQKHAVGHMPETVLRVPVAEDHGAVGTYVAVESAPGLLALAQTGVMEFHVWGAHMDTVEYPDQIVFDFDPDPELPFRRVIEGARLMHDLLEGLGLQSFVKTTGGKGLHVVAPVEPRLTWDEVKAFTKACADSLATLDPSRYLVNMSLKKRVGKTYVDYLRNGRGASFIAAYSTRRRPGAPVSAPVRWDELTPRLRGDTFTVKNMKRRLARLDEDPWAGYAAVKQRITDDMLRSAGLPPAKKRAA
jgi:bifunctional non-homologous end joining protein LigD